MLQRINLEIYPQLFQSATANLLAQRYQSAKRQYLTCLQSNPASYSSYLNLASIFHRENQYTKAISILQLAINIKPYCSEAYYNRCLAYMALQKTKQQSQRQYQQAACDIRAALSCLYFEKFKQAGNFQFLEISVSLCQNNLEALRLLAVLSKTKDIRQNYKQMLEQYEDNYQITAGIKKVKNYASAQQGLFRLLPSTYGECSYQEVMSLINSYIDLTNQTHSQKKSNIFSISSAFSLKIFQPHQEQYQKQNKQLFVFQKIEINPVHSPKLGTIFKPLAQRHSTHTFNPLRQISNMSLTIPNAQSRYSLASNDSSFLSGSIRGSRCHFDGKSIGSSRNCHNGCAKCKRESDQMPIIPNNALKMLVKTTEIYRNQNICNPKPYLMIYDGLNTFITEVDYENGHFPKWSQAFYLQKQSQNPYRIELWHKGHKDKQDQLIGSTIFGNKLGRFKHYFVKKYGGVKRTGYIFLQLAK